MTIGSGLALVCLGILDIYYGFSALLWFDIDDYHALATVTSQLRYPRGLERRLAFLGRLVASQPFVGEFRQVWPPFFLTIVLLLSVSYSALLEDVRI